MARLLPCLLLVGVGAAGCVGEESAEPVSRQPSGAQPPVAPRLTLSAWEADADRMAGPCERPEWDESVARGLLGKHVLVGLTFERPSGEPIVQVQLHGEVTHVHADHGIGLTRGSTGELFWLPPDLGAFDEARPGEYRLRSTGEVLVDPDFLSVWTITEPDDDVVPDWRETLRVGFEPAAG